MQGFDVIRQFDEMRQTLTPQLAPITPAQAPKIELPEYAPAEAPLAVPTGLQGASGVPPAPAPYKGAGGPTGPMKLVNWRGRQIDQSVMSNAERLAQQFPGLRLTSAYRDPARNARTPGAAKNSWHMKGRAVDFAGNARDMASGAAWARQNGAREVLVHNAGTGQHLHVAW